MSRSFGDLAVGARHDLIATVQVLLEMLMPMSEASLGSVANTLGMHPRTLQRRLQALGWNLSDLLDQQRRIMAGQLLREQRMSLTELAFTLGYSEQSAFNHAFQRWFGEAPGRWAARHRPCRIAAIADSAELNRHPVKGGMDA